MKQTQSAGGVVINPKGQVLVVNQNGTSWSLPKGHIEEGEDALTAAQREIYEESGISHLKFVKNLGHYQRYKIGLDGGEDPSELKTIHMFLFQTDQEVLNPRDPENPEARWVEKDKVADLLTHPKDKEFFLRVKEEL
jgi:8-oxo-dGTP pyrophosphatase MutT (NUDIX family)